MNAFIKDLFNKHLVATNLCAVPSFFRDMSRIVDMWGYLDDYRYTDWGVKADCEALKRDYGIVMHDLSDAVEKYEQKRRRIQPGNTR